MHISSRPTPPTSSTALVSVTAATSPRTKAIIGSSLERPGCLWPGRGLRLGFRTATASSMRVLAEPRHTWVMASARASAASAGLGISDRRRIRTTIAPTWALSARPLPDTAALTSLGVCMAIGSPRRAATTSAIPLAWAVPMIVLESERAKTRSTATASGRCSSIQASRPLSMVTSRCAIGRSALVRITPTSTIVSGRPTLPSTTPTPHLVRPGSMPSTRILHLRLAVVVRTPVRAATLTGRGRGSAYDTRRGLLLPRRAAGRSRCNAGLVALLLGCSTVWKSH